MTMGKRSVWLPAMGMGMAAAAVGVTMMKKKKKPTVPAAAGKAIKAVGEVVESFSNAMKN